jgi:ribonucleotide monophosphatase NagD (HAD superfamily)
MNPSSPISPDDLAAYAPKPRSARVDLEDAEGIVCTGLADDLTETPDDYRAALLLGKTLGLPMLCANPDIVVDMGDTAALLRWGTGPSL